MHIQITPAWIPKLTLILFITHKMYLQLDYAKHVTYQGHIVDIDNYLQYTLYNASPKELFINYCIL